MNETDRTNFTARLQAAADAKKTLLEKFKPKPSVTNPNLVDRVQAREAELEQVRRDRAEAKTAKREAAAEAAQAESDARAAAQAAELDAKRGERKERKALTKAEQKAKRDARYAARKARN